jgi:hypothetical protein
MTAVELALAHTVAEEAGIAVAEEVGTAVDHKAQVEEHHTAAGHRAVDREVAGEEEGLGCSHTGAYASG